MESTLTLRLTNGEIVMIGGGMLQYGDAAEETASDIGMAGWRGGWYRRERDVGVFVVNFDGDRPSWATVKWNGYES